MRACVLTVAVCCVIGALPAIAQTEDAGKAVFDKHCVHCHGADDEAVGTVQLRRTRGEQFALLTERDDLAAPYVEYIVRNGLKAMPAFVPSELTEAKLDALTAYLTR